MKRSLIGLRSNQYSDEKIIVISFHFNDILNKNLSNWLFTTITLIFLDVHGYWMVCDCLKKKLAFFVIQKGKKIRFSRTHLLAQCQLHVLISVQFWFKMWLRNWQSLFISLQCRRFFFKACDGKFAAIAAILTWEKWVERGWGKMDGYSPFLAG